MLNEVHKRLDLTKTPANILTFDADGAWFTPFHPEVANT